MHIGNSSQFNSDSLLKYANKSCAIAGAVVIFMFCAMAFHVLRQKNSSTSSTPTISQLETKSAPQRQYEAIGTGALSLNSYRFSEFIPRLGREILLIARNTRPDAYKSEPRVLLGLKSAKEERIIKSGELFYLKDNEKGWRTLLTFSSKQTPLALKPLFSEKGGVSFEVTREGEQEKRQFALAAAASSGQMGKELLKKQEAPYVQALKLVKCWGKDLLIQNYGGDEYRQMKDKQKVQFETESSSNVCYVAQGDYLSWQGERWKVIPFEEVSQDAPLAYIQAATPKGLEIVVWDETGFFRFPLKVETQTAPKLVFKVEQFFTSMRLRNSTQVSCIAGKRRLILSEGDWLLKTATGWRHLKKWQQIEDCLNHRTRGELFIVESLEKTQGKIMLKGQLFDEMRTQIYPLEFPVTAEKKQARSRTKRKREQ